MGIRVTRADDQDLEVVVGAECDHFEPFYEVELAGQVRRAYLMVGSAAEAHDIVHDAFVAVFQRWGSIDQPGSYLNRCVLNGCRQHGRKSTRETPAESAEDMATVHGSSDHLAVEIADLLLSLPFRQRATIVLRYYGGHTENEIAEILGMRPGSVGPSIHRGLKKLRKAVQ